MLRALLTKLGLIRNPKPTAPRFDGRYLKTLDGQLLRKRSYQTGTMHRIDFVPVSGDETAAPESFDSREG